MTMYKKILAFLGCCVMATGVMAAEQVKITTNQGDIVIELNAEKAPKSTENFLKYVDKKFYNDTIFHRVIPGFMIQGGGFTKDMQQKATDAPIANEADNGLKNVRGSVAMARTMDPNSATSQFFINLVDNAALDYKGPQNQGYAVFGKVTSGMDVVDKIAKQKTSTQKGHQDVPVEAVIMTSVTRVK
jgi:cyclophilin family peptidyl-prolyl cis-trans isomerase